jgi:hypothetical protein
MQILAHQTQHKDFRTAAHTLRKHGIAVTGPYRRRNGTLVFSVADSVVTEEELLRFQRDGKISANAIQDLLSKADKRQS